MIFDRASAYDVTAEDIRALIDEQAPEQNDLEFKEAADTRDLPKDACAIANYGGGFLLWGIREDSTHRACDTKGVPNAYDVAEKAGQIIRDTITPRVVVEVAVVQVGDDNVTVIQVLPSNPPHMVSSEDRSDFYNRYNATTKRMRYEDIHQMFRDKHEPTELSQAPLEVIATTSGRIEVSLGTMGSLEGARQKVVQGKPKFALIATCDRIQDSIDDKYAHLIFTQPLYDRRGGWLVADPEVQVDFRSGEWLQQRGPYSLTVLTPSGDVTFTREIADTILCPEQDELDSLFFPLLYPNALTEYCLSFAYLLADITATSKPRNLLVRPMVFAGDLDVKLPLGFGGTKEFKVNCESANTILDKKSAGLPVAEAVTLGKPILARAFAYKLVKQIYSFFGYNPSVLPSTYGEIRVGEPDTLTAFSLRAYLRSTLMMPVQPPAEDFSRGGIWFGIERSDGRFLFMVSEEFIFDHHWSEKKLFELLDSYKTADRILGSNRGEHLLLTNDGISRVAK